MAIYIVDPWDALSPGFSGPPPGWSLFGSSTVSASDGAFPGHNFGSGFFSPLSTPVFSDPNPNPDAPQVQVCFGAKVSSQFRMDVSLEDTSFLPFPMFTLIAESDQSLSLRSGSSTSDFLLDPAHSNMFCNTGLINGIYFNPGVWYYFLLQISATAGAGAATGFLQVTAALFVDGSSLTSGAGAYIPLSNFPTSGGALNSQFDQVSWFGSSGGSFSTQVQVSDWGTPVPDPTSPFARIPQAVIEPGQLGDPFVRIPQAVIEPAQLGVPFVRIPQMVIELASPFQSQRGPFPEYIKRRALFANN